VTEARNGRLRGRPPKGAPPAPDEQVLAAALRAFATHGYNGVSIRTLNRELGVSHNLLHQRFGSKSGIWYAAVDWGFGAMVEELIRTDDETLDPLERVRAFIRTFALLSAGNPDLHRLINVESTQSTERLDYLWETYLVPLLALLLPLYSELVVSGRLRDVPLTTLFYQVTSGAAAMFSSDALTLKLRGGTAPTRKDVERHAEAVADLLINGLQPLPD
jgi:TetR/AcrR family transcriptional regulator